MKYVFVSIKLFGVAPLYARARRTVVEFIAIGPAYTVEVFVGEAPFIV
jgi:hypothetical protein